MSSTNVDIINRSSCRICLSTKKPLCPLFRYKLSGNYAEMLTSVADVKVSSNDGLPDQICVKCCTALERAFLLKTIAERSDKLLRVKLEKGTCKRTKKIAFDSLTDIKSEIGPLAVKSEPKWEMEIDILANESGVVPTSVPDELKDIVIANTVIRKVDPNSAEDVKNDFFDDAADVSWKSVKSKNDDSIDMEFLEDDFFNNDDDDDDYVPPPKFLKSKTKFKKPKLSEIKVFREKKKPLMKKIKVLRKSDLVAMDEEDRDNKPGQLITCYPIMKNGCRGPPILLKRPKDATILKVHPNYKSRKPSLASPLPRSISVRDKPVKLMRTARKTVQSKQKEKMVCPICGILTFTLGNHMSTHQEKKRFTCSQCPRSFAQKGNLEVHVKQHSGVKDHICEICGAGFYSQKSLLRHNLIHKGERPFACTLCNKRFIARCDLNRHLRIHSGYKPYKCNTCTMSFNAKHQLQNHERMHTGERPYSCQVCNVAFSYKVNLNNHVYKVHGVNLKFKSIHTVTEDILLREHEVLGANARSALANMGDVPPPAAHETVPHHAHDHYSL